MDELKPLQSKFISAVVMLLAFAAYFAVGLSTKKITGSPVVTGILTTLCAVAFYYFFFRKKPLNKAIPARFKCAIVPIVATTWLASQTLALFLMTHSERIFNDYLAKMSQMADEPAHLLLLLALVFGPVTEEVLMRGILFRTLRESLKCPLWLSVFVSATAFSLLHANIAQISSTLLLGVITSLVVEISGRVSPAVLTHVLFNLLSYAIPATSIERFSTLPSTIALNVTALAATLLLGYSCTAGRQAEAGSRGIVGK